MQSNLFSSTAIAVAKEPRDYQQDAIEAIFDYFVECDGAPLVVIPTGGGKSLTMAEFMRQANVYFPGTAFMVLCDSALLLKQNAEELLEQWPQADISFYSDTLGQKNLSGNVIFAGIQSVYKKAYLLRHAPDLLLVDEAHMIGPDNGSMYRKFFDDMMIINPNIKIVGFTATPFRAGDGMLHKGKNALFTHIAYEIPIIELINRGHLVPIVTPDGGVSTKMDVAGVKKNKGDYIQTQLAKAVDTDEITTACVDEILAHGASRNKGIIFTVDIEHCTHVMEEIRARGESCEMVHSKMESGECARAIDRFKNGDAKYLVNVAMLTKGANFPKIDLMAFMRPTRSPVLYIQMAGRGMRTFPGKVNCLLLDFGGVVEELGPIDQVRVPEKGDGEGEAPTKTCEACGAICFAGCAVCPSCGALFPENGLNLDTKPSDAAALSSQLKAKWIPVKNVAFYRHKKEGKPDTLRVDYLCGMETYKEWQCLEHTGYPREKACIWWRARSDLTPPNTITEAITRSKELIMPTEILVKKIGKYHEIIGARFGEDSGDGDEE